ncbi:glycosyltransferase family 9 protein [Methylophilaceae bacterium]|nr:glycosyltransferase family 9 protein [Methylophilaceae bacterium]
MKLRKKNILIIKHGAFGDLIQSDGIFRTIKYSYSNANLILLTSSSYKDLMLLSPYVDKVIVDDRFKFWNLRKIFQLINEIKILRFSHVFDLQNSQRTFLYKILLTSPIWVTTKRKDHPISGLQGLVDMLIDNGIQFNKILEPNIAWMANDISVLLKKKNIIGGYIVLIPGSSKKHKEKRWPYYKELAEKLLKEDFNVVSILGPDELDLENNIPGDKFSNLDLMDVAGIIKKSIFVIGNDSGPSHIASCLRKPGIALFGPTTSATKSELSRKPFQILESENLKDLKVSKVWRSIKKII